MAFSEWALVIFGLAVAASGSWLQLHPARIFPMAADWQPDPSALAQVRLLGGCFVFMGAFFAAQMAFILASQPWWLGTLSGLAIGVMAVTLLSARNTRRQQLGSALKR